MKGLLVKDIRLIFKQKIMLLAVAGISVFLFFYGVDLAFILAYLIFLMTILVVNTISYDALDNGMAYLMTMPMRRREYVMEKYGLMLGVAFGMTVLAIGAKLVLGLLQQPELNLMSVLGTSVMSFFAITLMAAVIIPLNLKFGAENGKIVMFVMTLVIATTGSFLMHQDFGELKEAVIGIVPMFTSGGEGMLLAALGVVWLVLMGISLAVSIGIMKKKEY